MLGKLIAALFTIFASGVGAQGTPLDKFNAEFARCEKLTEDQRLHSLRVVFPLDGSSNVTDAMLQASIAPTSVQTNALRLYKAIVVACRDRATDAYVGSGGDTTGLQLRRRVDELKLNLLLGGRLTFADYAAFERHSAFLTNFYITRIAELQAQVANAQAPKPVVGLLVCTIESAGTGSFELQISFDEAKNTAWANKGPPITASWLTPSEIVMKQGTSTTSISRHTGRIDVNLGGGASLSGMCQPAQQRRF